MTNIYVLAPSSGGKTSTGKLVAHTLKRPFVNHDDLFESRHGSIWDYGKTHGWAALAPLMAEIIRETHAKDGQVIAPFASAFAFEEADQAIIQENIQICKHNGIFILLLPSRFDWRAIRILCQRASYRSNYVLNPKSVEKEYDYRVPRLMHIAQVIVYDNTSPESAAAKVVEALRKKGLIES